MRTHTHTLVPWSLPRSLLHLLEPPSTSLPLPLASSGLFPHCPPVPQPHHALETQLLCGLGSLSVVSLARPAPGGGTCVPDALKVAHQALLQATVQSRGGDIWGQAYLISRPLQVFSQGKLLTISPL